MSTPVQIPADVGREDQLLAGLTARQLSILAGVGTVLYGLWALVAPLVGVGGFAIVAVPVAMVGIAVVFGRRDGVGLDRLLVAALAQRAGTARIPGAWVDGVGALRTVLAGCPLRAVRPAASGPELGVLDLGRDGSTVVCEVSAVSFGLRSATEQDALVAGFARWLHSLTQPVQILIRTIPLDVHARAGQLHQDAARAAHPALAAAAHAHAQHLSDLAAGADLFRRRILLVFRDPAPAPGADEAGRAAEPARALEERLRRRIGEAAHLLGAIGLQVTVLDVDAAAELAWAALRPDRHLHHPPTTAVPAGRRPPDGGPGGPGSAASTAAAAPADAGRSPDPAGRVGERQLCPGTGCGGGRRGGYADESGSISAPGPGFADRPAQELDRWRYRRTATAAPMTASPPGHTPPGHTPSGPPGGRCPPGVAPWAMAGPHPGHDTRRWEEWAASGLDGDDGELEQANGAPWSLPGAGGWL